MIPLVEKQSPEANLGIKKKFKKPTYSNSAASQCARLLEHFYKCPRITTIQARDEMGILHPPGRAKDLRRRGYKIDTIWVHAPDQNGVNHRIGMYIFHGLKNEAGI